MLEAHGQKMQRDRETFICQAMTRMEAQIVLALVAQKEEIGKLINQRRNESKPPN